MKVVLFMVSMFTCIFAEYEKGKIDMHGGQENYSYEKKGFYNNSKGSMLQGMISDQNRSKSSPDKK